MRLPIISQAFGFCKQDLDLHDFKVSVSNALRGRGLGADSSLNVGKDVPLNNAKALNSMSTQKPKELYQKLPSSFLNNLLTVKFLRRYDFFLRKVTAIVTLP